MVGWWDPYAVSDLGRQGGVESRGADPVVAVHVVDLNCLSVCVVTEVWHCVVHEDGVIEAGYCGELGTEGAERKGDGLVSH